VGGSASPSPSAALPVSGYRRRSSTPAAEGAPHAWTPQAGHVAASAGHGWTLGCEAVGRSCATPAAPPARCASTSVHACSPTPPHRAMAARAAPPRARAGAAPVPRQLTRAGVAFQERGQDGGSGRGRSGPASGRPESGVQAPPVLGLRSR